MRDFYSRNISRGPQDMNARFVSKFEQKIRKKINSITFDCLVNHFIINLQGS